MEIKEIGILQLILELDIINIFKNIDVSEKANHEKDVTIVNSDFLNGLKVAKAINVVINKIEEEGIGKAKINYRLRDAIFSRQRYWGGAFPYLLQR